MYRPRVPNSELVYGGSYGVNSHVFGSGCRVVDGSIKVVVKRSGEFLTTSSYPFVQGFAPSAPDIHGRRKVLVPVRYREQLLAAIKPLGGLEF